MILTGKTKADFLKENKWVEELLFHEVDEIYINALIIDWLDEKGIYISIEFNNSNVAYILSSVEFSYSITTSGENYIDFYYKTRREATVQAIIKANEIYNLKFRE